MYNNHPSTSTLVPPKANVNTIKAMHHSFWVEVTQPLVITAGFRFLEQVELCLSAGKLEKLSECLSKCEFMGSLWRLA